MLTNMLFLLVAGLVAGAFAALYSMKNKKLKRWISLALVCVVVLYLAISCGPKASERPFRQPVENIASVTIRTGDIYDRETGEYGILKELSASESMELIYALQELEISYKYYTAFLDPNGKFLEIQYLDGEIERLTYYNNFWITQDGKDFYGGYYFKEAKLFDEILKRYY